MQKKGLKKADGGCFRNGSNAAEALVHKRKKKRHKPWTGGKKIGGKLRKNSKKKKGLARKRTKNLTARGIAKEKSDVYEGRLEKWSLEAGGTRTLAKKKLV